MEASWYFLFLGHHSCTHRCVVLFVNFDGLVSLCSDQSALRVVEHTGEDSRLAVQRSGLHGRVDPLKVVSRSPVPHVDGSVVGFRRRKKRKLNEESKSWPNTSNFISAQIYLYRRSFKANVSLLKHLFCLFEGQYFVKQHHLQTPRLHQSSPPACWWWRCVQTDSGWSFRRGTSTVWCYQPIQRRTCICDRGHERRGQSEMGL